MTSSITVQTTLTRPSTTTTSPKSTRSRSYDNPQSRPGPGALERLTACEIFTIAVLLQGKLEECEPLYLKVITILEKTGSPNLASVYNNLAGLYQDQVLWHCSITPRRTGALNSVLELDSTSFCVAAWQGKLEEAIELYKKATVIGEQTLGKEHPDVATRYNNLASVYQAQVL